MSGAAGGGFEGFGQGMSMDDIFLYVRRYIRRT